MVEFGFVVCTLLVHECASLSFFNAPGHLFHLVPRRTPRACPIVFMPLSFVLLLLLRRAGVELVAIVCRSLGCEIRPEINVSDRNFGCYGK